MGSSQGWKEMELVLPCLQHLVFSGAPRWWPSSFRCLLQGGHGLLGFLFGVFVPPAALRPWAGEGMWGIVAVLPLSLPSILAGAVHAPEMENVITGARGSAKHPGAPLEAEILYKYIYFTYIHMYVSWWRWGSLKQTSPPLCHSPAAFS